MRRSFAIIMVVEMKNRRRIYTVSQVNTLIKVVLEDNLPPRLIVRGEISDWKHHSSGHCYFSLKDENAVLPCVMWASRFGSVKFSPEDGMAVLATGHIDVYAVGGKYQLYVDKLEPEGVGALQLAFEQMYKRLKAEGLFEEKYKKPLPKYPMRIGILTSESGAAVHDIRDSIFHRWPCARLLLYPVPVQGEGAAEEIMAAIRDINRRNERLGLDVLIVGRGGGSLEDLWAFNGEVLARAIFDSKIPIISAVGHEVDTTIADLVADARASTPTKAGVTAVPDAREVLGQLEYFERRLGSEARGILQLCGESLRTVMASAVFRNPLLPVRNAEQNVDELGIRLADLTRKLLAEGRAKLQAGYEQVVKIEPHRLLARRTVDLNNLMNRAGTGVKMVINRGRMGLTAQENRLAALNPKSVLQRGYSITTAKKTGLLIRKPKDIKAGDYLITELAEENLIESKVTRK
jgi:exodeoxyribonuclease VII large subunit